MSDQAKTRILGVRTVGVPVADQDRAVEFFVGVLGFEKRLDVPVEQLGGRWIEVAPAGTAVTIALVPAREGLPTGVETGVRFTAEDAVALHAELVDAGIDAGELLQWPGIPPMFTVRDPDGNGFEITG